MSGSSSLPAASAGLFCVFRQRVMPSLAAGAVLASGFLGVQVFPASAEESESTQCGAIVAADQGQSRQINLVLDDSGSMFKDFKTNTILNRWSHAKYSLGVFAALMGPRDLLNVYRLSDFAGRNSSERPELELAGANNSILNVQLIDDMAMQGRGTPFVAVEGAFTDLQASGAQEKWLVVLTDGKFRVPGDDGNERDIEQDELRGLIKNFAEEGRDQDIRIAYLALGRDIPTVASQPKSRIYGEEAQDTEKLLGRVEKFANQIFGRDELPDSVFTSSNPPTADIDIDMEEMIVFSQGSNIEIGPLQTQAGTVNPTTSVDVKWSDNPYEVKGPGGGPVPSVPDQGLQGQVAYFGQVPKGTVGFSIVNARTGIPTVFYRPQVRLGYELRTPDGEAVRGTAVEAGDYAVTYGFQDVECNFVDSELLGDVQYLSTSITVGDQVVAEDFKSGDVITFPEGKADIEIVASYLQGTIVPGVFTSTFLKPALMSRMVAAEAKFKVSDMADFQADSAAISLEYTVIEDGVSRLPDAGEWAALDPKTFEIESKSNLDFDLKKLDEPGQLLLRARAPEGNVFDADTGKIDATVRGSYAADRPDLFAEETVQFQVEDDISAWDRFKNWFATIGWKILVGLLLLAILLGYLFKRRFARNVRPRPEITGTPRMVGMTALQDRGRFQVNGLRKVLPFVANTATLSYVPAGTPGFRKLKLKAGPGKSMVVTNWKEIAERDNVEINGTPINAEMRKPPRFGSGGTITAATPQMTYEMTPNI
jgi:hypothetical protein